jgi:hypothetical protein
MVLIGALLYPVYDYLSLASFLDAAPSLETFNLHVSCCSYCYDFIIVVVGHDLNLSFLIVVMAAMCGECFSFCRSCRSEADARTEAPQP